jgi:hypothetical protein
MRPVISRRLCSRRQRFSALLRAMRRETGERGGDPCHPVPDAVAFERREAAERRNIVEKMKRVRWWDLGVTVALVVLCTPAFAQDSSTTVAGELVKLTLVPVPESQPAPKTETGRSTTLQSPPAAFPQLGECQLPNASGDPKKWRNQFGLYWFVPAFAGSGRVAGSPTFKVSASISKVWDALKDHGDGNIAFHYEGGPAKYKVLLDLNYWKLDYTALTRIGLITLNPSQWIIELGGAVPVLAKPMPGGGYTVEGLTGVRYTRLTLDHNNATLGTSGSSTRDWADFFAGARARYFMKRMVANLRFDLGAGGSQWTYNFISTIGYRFTGRNSVNLGWRVLEQQYESGGFKWFVQQNGPLFTLQNQF